MLSYYRTPRSLTRRSPRFINGNSAEVHIPLDVIAEGDDFLITAFVPGIDAENVKIEVIEDTVSIEGEFIDELNEDAKYLMRERPSGSFSRKLRLPSSLDAGQAQAEVTNGVLTLRVSKAEEAKAKQIKVKAK